MDNNTTPMQDAVYKCAKQFLCSRKECKFLSWIYIKNYGEVTRVKNNIKEK